jgi:hypothetical protein
LTPLVLQLSGGLYALQELAPSTQKYLLLVASLGGDFGEESSTVDLLDVDILCKDREKDMVRNAHGNRKLD